MTKQFQTLTEALEKNRSEEHFVGFIEGQGQEKAITFEALYQRALGLLYILQQQGMQKGDYLILFLNNNEQMVDVFWACQFGGIIPVPLAVGISDQHRQKVFNVAQKLGKTFLYTDRKNLLKLESSAQEEIAKSTYQQLAERVLLSDDIVDISLPGQVENIVPEDTSFIQFSSGSTGSPKGVVLKHRNLIANIEGIQKGAAFTSADISLSWMPLTHDMGLIGFHLNPIVCNYSHFIMRTDLFVRRPLYWMTATSEKKASVLCSPNFGYKHFLNAFKRKGLNAIDLSHVRLVFNGAEPISVSLCEQFTRELAQYGLPKHCMFAVYGLAEASLAVSFPEINAPLQVVHAQRDSLSIEKVVVLNSQDDDSVSLVGVGKPIVNCKVRISDKNGNSLAENTVGHIHIRGGNVTEEIIGDDGSNFLVEGWVDTGDIGFVCKQGLFITGRFKEILFVNGQNYYPYDLEESLHQIPNLELGKVVVAGVTSKQSGLEEVLVFVLYKGELESFLSLASNVTAIVNEQFGIEVHQVIPIKKVPKTTSGKIQHSALADAYLAGEYNDIVNQLSALAEKNLTANDEGPTDAVVNSIKQICMEALPNKSFSIHDSLLELGASSLALVEIHTGLDELYPGKIEITDLVEHSSISDLAKFVREKEALII